MRWSKLQHDFQALGPDPADKIWLVCCDVLIIDEDPTIDGELTIFARQIEVEGHRTLNITSEAGDTTFVTQGISSPKDASFSASYSQTGKSDDILRMLNESVEESTYTLQFMRQVQNLEWMFWRRVRQNTKTGSI